jgi:hypothetical protein
MRISKKVIFITILSAIMLAVILLSYGWYYIHYIWPEEIQANVLGRSVVGNNFLLKREGYSHYGEGEFRWEYRVARENREVVALCYPKSITVCSFRKSRRINEGVEQTVVYVNGVLIVEEVWS